MWHVGCMPHHQTTWRELNRQHSMWVACRVIKQHGGKEKADMASGLHAASSKERNRQCGVWVAHCIIKQHRGNKIDDAVCGLHTASLSPSLSPFPLLPTLLTLLQPSHLVVIVFHVVAGAGNMGAAAEVAVGWCMGLLMSMTAVGGCAVVVV